MNTSNFAFLTAFAEDLAKLATEAESFVGESPGATVWLVRVFGESAAKLTLRNCGIPVPTRGVGFSDLINLLGGVRQVKVSGSLLDELNTIRRIANEPVHTGLGTNAEAMECLRLAHSVAGRYVRLFFEPTLELPPFRPPKAAHRELRGLREQARDTARERKTLEQKLAETEQREAAAIAALDEQIDSLSAALASKELQLRMDREDRNETYNFDYDRRSVWLEQSSHLVHFVGRDRELQRVAEWVTRPNSSDYLLVVGPAGQGKSALIAKIAESLYESAVTNTDLRGLPVLLYMPSGGRDQRTALQFLLRQASNFCAREVKPNVYRSSISDLRERFLELLETIVQEHGSVLIVIDGLDELVNHLASPQGTCSSYPIACPMARRQSFHADH